MSDLDSERFSNFDALHTLPSGQLLLLPFRIAFRIQLVFLLVLKGKMKTDHRSSWD